MATLVRKVSVQMFADTAEAQRKLDAIDAEARKLAELNPEIKVKIESAAATAKLTVLRHELKASAKEAEAAGSSRGGFGILTGAIGGLAGTIGSGGAGAGGGLAGAIAALSPAIAAIGTVAIGAGTGIGAFGVLALPTFMKVGTALGKIKTDQQAVTDAVTKAAKSTALAHLQKDWQNLSSPIAGAVKAVQALETEFGKLAKAFQPEALKLLGIGLHIADQAMGPLARIAKIAAPYVDELAMMVGQLLVDALKTIKPLVGPAFQAFIPLLASINRLFLTLLTDLASHMKTWVQLTNAITNLIIVSLPLVTFLVNVIALMAKLAVAAIPKFISGLHDIAHNFDEDRRHIAVWADDVAHFFEQAYADVKNWVGNVSRAFGTLKDTVHFLWDQVEIFTLRLISNILSGFSHIPFIGHYFKSARDDINAQLTRIEGDSRRTWGRVEADMMALHGKKVALIFSLDLPPGVSFPSRHIKGHAAGGMVTPGELAWVGEQGPELVHFRGPATVYTHRQSRKIAAAAGRGIPGYAAGTLDSFSASFPPTRGLLSAFQAAVGEIAREIRGLIGVLHVTRPGGGAPPGSTGPGPLAAQAWMKSHMGAYGWGMANWPPLLNLWTGESGWRWNAQNPTSPAYGIPQADPGSKMAAMGADWRTNPVTQMRWGASYIRSVYGNPMAAWNLWLSRSPHWYDGGSGPQFLPRGLSLAMNGTGAPERVLSPGESRGLEKRLDRVIALLEAAPGLQAQATTRALNGLVPRIPAPRARGR